MREETQLLSNTLKEVAKAILKDADDTAKFVDGRSKGALIAEVTETLSAFISTWYYNFE